MVDATQEGPNGATICVVRRAGSNMLSAIAFNPATPGSFARIDGASVATADPTCTNANLNTNGHTNQPERVICVFNTNGAIVSAGFNTTPFEFLGEFAYPVGGFNATDVPSCSAPNDGTGDVLCAIIDGGELSGFAINPITKTKSNNMLVDPATGWSRDVGTPSCSGIGDISFEIICGLVTEFSLSGDGNNLVIFPFAFKFDPRKGVVTTPQYTQTMEGTDVSASGNLSCTFQNKNAAQISCGSPYFGTMLGIIFDATFNPITGVQQ
jgi:hypothetical protein